MALFEEEPRKKKTVHEIGQDLATLSVGELEERISLLREEISRLEAEKAANVKLDQAAIHLRLGDAQRALTLIRAAEEAFLQLEAPQSTRMGLAFLRQTLSRRAIPATLVLRLADLVRRGQRTVRG